jgi:hypothetical protein
MLSVMPAVSQGAINLELRQFHPNPLPVGGFADQDLYAVWDGSGDDTISAIDLLFTWDPAHLSMDGSDDSFSETPILASFFPTGSGEVNDASPPTTGQGQVTVFMQAGQTATISQTGTLVTTLLFTALSPTPGTPISLVSQIDTHHTKVYGGAVENSDVTGTLTGSTVVITPEPGALVLLAAAAAPLCIRRRRRET